MRWEATFYILGVSAGIFIGSAMSKPGGVGINLRVEKDRVILVGETLKGKKPYTCELVKNVIETDASLYRWECKK